MLHKCLEKIVIYITVFKFHAQEKTNKTSKFDWMPDDI